MCSPRGGRIYDGIVDLDADAIDSHGLTGQVPAGKWWVVCEDHDGFISVDEFDSAADYEAAIRTLESEYAEFEGD